MSFKTRLVAIILVAVLAIGIICVGNSNNRQEEADKEQSYYQTESVYLWYSDDSYTDFFTNAAVAFHEQYPEIRVIPTLVDSAEYIEGINKASLLGEDYPDIYMLTNDSLEKAYLAGLASKAKDVSYVLDSNHFSSSALSAVTYQGNYVAYPFTFDTTVLFYNKTLIQDWVDRVNSGEVTQDDTSYMDDEGNVYVDEEDLSAEVSKDVIVSDYIPKSFDDIKNFADEYEAGDGVESVFKWDVSDVFFNYLFVGNYMVVGGDAGDDSTNIDIYNNDTVQCVTTYQGLRDTFSIDMEETEYESTLQDVIDGKQIFTIVTSDAIAKVNEVLLEREEGDASSEDGDTLEGEASESTDTSDTSDTESTDSEDSKEKTEYEYGFSLIPNVSDTYDSRSLSVTNVLVINGYSEKKTAANKFAAFVTTNYADQIYQRTGKLSASYNAKYTDEASMTFQEEYSTSIPLPKLVEASNLWVQLEITFMDIWGGEDAATRLKSFADQIQSQLVAE